MTYITLEGEMVTPKTESMAYTQTNHRIEALEKKHTTDIENTRQTISETASEIDTQISNEINTVNSRIMSEISTINNRFDNIIAHNNDTEGNSELIDIRKGVFFFPYKSAGSAIRSQISDICQYATDITSPLELNVNFSNNKINSFSAVGTAFNTIFTDSRNVYYPVGYGMTVTTSTGYLAGTVLFDDDTMGTLGGWVAEDSNGDVVVNGAVNNAKAVTEEQAKRIVRVGFFFGSNARTAYNDKIIKNIGLYSGSISPETSWIDNYHAVYTSERLNSLDEYVSEHTDIFQFSNENVYNIVQGSEFSIYLDTIFRTNHISDVYFTVSTALETSYCSLMDRCLRIQNTCPVGEYSVTLNAKQHGTAKTLATASFTLNVLPKVLLSAEVKCMFIGDSLTDQNYFVEAVKTLGGDNLTMCGTRGISPCNHEGRSSWRASSYCYSETFNNMTNPFYNANAGTVKFDFSYYMQNHSEYSGLKYVNIFLGRNDGFSNQNLITNLKHVINSIHQYDSDIVISVCLPYFSPAENNDYFAARKTSAAEMNINSFIGIDKFRAELADMNNVYLVPVGTNVDTVYDYPRTTRPVSTRNSSISETVYSDCVHPNQAGYAKMADVWYSWFNSTLL